MIHDAIFLLWDCPNTSELLTSEQYYKDTVTNLHPCEREMFKRIVQIAKCHGTIKRFINKNSFASGRNVDFILSNKLVNPISGLYVQALSEGLDEILEPYHKSIVELEKSALANPYLPLAYVLGTVQPFKPLFNTLTSILLGIKEKRFYGCQILHVLHRHALSGNEETTTAIQRLTFIVHRVFYEHLCSWLLYGDLKDKQGEFFIHSVEKLYSASPVFLHTSRMNSMQSANYSKSGDSGQIQADLNKTSKYWDYEINAVMLPYYIPISMAQKILFIGKTVVLFDSSPTETNPTAVNLLAINKDIGKRFTIWGEKEAEFHEAILELKNMDSFNASKLDILLDEIKLCVTEHLWVVAVEEAGVFHELQLMKDFFLLGRGELFLELLRLSEHLLEAAPTPKASEEMNQAFSLAARAVSLGNNRDIKKFYFSVPFMKCDVSASNAEYGILDGWSTLVLNYKVKWPLHLMFTPEIIYRYNEIFRFLLRVKKTQHDLHALWFAYKKSKRQSPSVWQLHKKLMFLVDNLQHYLQCDVLESNYSKMISEAEKSKDFELLKKAHNTFLTDILSQAFLLMTTISEESIEKEELDYGSNPVMSNIVEVLQLCDAFCTMVRETTNIEEEEYYIIGYTNRFELSVGKLLQLLIALRTQPCGTYLARLLMRLDFNRWFSNTHYLTQSVTSIL